MELLAMHIKEPSMKQTASSSSSSNAFINEVHTPQLRYGNKINIKHNVKNTNANKDIFKKQT